MNLFKIVPVFIAFVFIVVLAVWIGIGCLIGYGCRAVQKDGLKGVVSNVTEKVWNGPANTTPTNVVVDENAEDAAFNAIMSSKEK